MQGEDTYGVVDQDTQLFRELLHLTGHAACKFFHYVFFLTFICHIIALFSYLGVPLALAPFSSLFAWG